MLSPPEKKNRFSVALNESYSETIATRHLIQVQFHGNQIHFHKKSFAPGVVLEQKQKPTRKCLGPEPSLAATISLNYT